MKNILKKVLIIFVSLLMLFSLIGQFLVSAEEKDLDISNKPSEVEIEELNESDDQEIIQDQENKNEKSLKQEDDNELDPEKENLENKEEVVTDDKEKNNDIEEENNNDSEEVESLDSIIEMDTAPQVAPYQVFDLEMEEETNSLKGRESLNNPKVSCDNFEFVQINDNGEMINAKCFDKFDAAIAEMKKHSNGAVRHNASLSPMKFIAATRAIGHSVPHRIKASGTDKGQVTMNLKDAGGINDYTYLSRGYEMAYFKTKSFNPSNGTGDVHVGMYGFNGIANLKQLDIIPMAYVENKKMVEIGGSNEATAKFYKETRLNAAPAQSYYQVSTNNGVKEIAYISENLHRAQGNPYKAYYKANATLGPADEAWMKDNTRYYSWDGVNFYSDRDFNNHVGTYYNYYQYLPLRSKTSLTAKDLDKYLLGLNKNGSVMKNLGKDFIEYGLEYGMNPLLVYSLAAHESGWGMSKIAREKYNLFGWNAYDSDPGAATDFPTPGIAVKDHMGINLRGYLDVTLATGKYHKDYRYHGAHLGSRGGGLNFKYASDAFWGLKIASIAYKIDASSGLKDYKKYNIGLVVDPNENVVKENNVKVTKNGEKGLNKKDLFYDFKSKSGYINNYTTIVEESNKDFYKTSTFASIDKDRNIIQITSGKAHFKYEWYYSQGYVKQSGIKIVSKRVKAPPKPEEKPEPEEKPKPEEKPIKLGDVNEDGSIDIFDYVAVANHILEKKKLSGRAFKAADINKDKSVDIFDYVAIANHILEKKLIKGEY